MERGKLIYYEGGEGCGKSLQLKLMRDYLVGKGIRVINTREPGGTPLSERVRDILLDTKSKEIENWSEALLFQTSRALLYYNLVIPKLKEGITVQQDRGRDSSLAYQGYGRGGDLGSIKRLNKLSTFGYEPDLAFIINISPEKGLEKQLSSDRMSIDGLEFHRRVNKGYFEIAKENPNNYIVIPYIENGLEEMHEMMKIHVNKLFNF
ncbi:MAG: dTMP kinase [Nanoarchaeota archaeon]|nr:dTMP kinase [Nanoarchaeota archaeon]